MKSSFKVSISAMLAAAALGCEDYLDRPDLDSFTSQQFWKTPKHLELYVNQYYTSFPQWHPRNWSAGMYWNDQNSDNMVVIAPNRWLNGGNTINSGSGSYGFGSVRAMNYFIANADKVTGDEAKPFVGEGHFFRAYFNTGLLASFGSYPYTNDVLTEKSEELYAPRTPRTQIVDNILADLDKAAENMESGPQDNGHRLNKEIALLFKARVALYEGTWEKYHTGSPFAVPNADPDKYLTIAAEAAKAVMDSQAFEIHDTGNPEEDYGMLFNQTDYSANKEVMLWKDFSRALSTTHNGQIYLTKDPNTRGITRSLVNDYLCLDGQPIATSPLYEGDDSLAQVVKNRDWRLYQSIWIPGLPKKIVRGVVEERFTTAGLGASGGLNCPTGYRIRKGSDPDYDQYASPHQSTTSSPVFRYAEALLIYAEAKAELGTLNQADVDMSINLLRKRAGVEKLDLNNITQDENWLFPDLSPIINEIRRERRVELAMEGHRFNDMLRWAAMDELIVGKRTKGVKFNRNRYPNLTVSDLASGVKGEVFLDAEGYVDPYQEQLPSGYGFKPDRDYLLPIPPAQIVLNKDLTQNPGWGSE